MNNKRAFVPALAVLLILAASGGYYFFSHFKITKQQADQAVVPLPPVLGQGDTTSVKMSFPSNNRIEVTEKTLTRKAGPLGLAESVITEYFKLSANGKFAGIPKDVRLLNLYRDPGQILYLDLSDELRRNFQGDALSEYLLLKGLYESLVANVPDVLDVKILLEGKEIETLGGHLYLKFPLKNLVSYEPEKDEVILDAPQ